MTRSSLILLLLDGGGGSDEEELRLPLRGGTASLEDSDFRLEEDSLMTSLLLLSEVDLVEVVVVDEEGRSLSGFLLLEPEEDEERLDLDSSLDRLDFFPSFP